MEKTTILIPYISSTAKAEELRYVLRSIDKHIKGEIEVVIIGDRPEYVSDAVIHIAHKQQSGPGINLPKCNDAWNKLKTAINSGKVSQVFVYTYDDIIFLQDMEPMQLRKLYAENDLVEVDGNKSWLKDKKYEKHIAMVKATFDALRAAKLPAFNYESHMPKVLNGTRVLRIERHFNAQKKRLLPNLLYFNYYFKDKTPQLLAKGDKVKVAFDGGPKGYSNKSKATMLKALEGAQFLNWNDDGYNQNLEDVIKELFPDKCRFEV